MKIKTIQCSESHELMTQMGLKKWIKMGMEAELFEEDNPDESMLELRKQLQLLFQITDIPKPNFYSHIHDPSMVPYGEPNTPPQPIPVNDISKEKVEIAIDNAPDIDELAKLKILAEKHYLQTAYINKMKQFV